LIKIYDNREVQKISIECDLYIPIDIKFGNWDNVLEPTVYWRTGDFQKSIIEVGIGKYSQKIRSITLVGCDKVFESKKSHRRFQDVTSGCPIVSICNLSDNSYIDEEGAVEVHFKGNDVYILFSGTEATSCMENESVEFLLDLNSNWVGICIKDIDKVNLSILKESLKQNIR